MLLIKPLPLMCVAVVKCFLAKKSEIPSYMPFENISVDGEHPYFMLGNLLGMVVYHGQVLLTQSAWLARGAGKLEKQNGRMGDSWKSVNEYRE